MQPRVFGADQRPQDDGFFSSIHDDQTGCLAIPEIGARKNEIQFSSNRRNRSPVVAVQGHRTESITSPWNL